MKDSVILEGKIYISAKRAAKIINYAQDYIGQLCRSGKLDCKMIGRSWFVTEESLLAHRENAIDNTQERVLKVIKNNDVAIKETIKSVVENKKEVSTVVTNTAPVVVPVAAAPSEVKSIPSPIAPVVSPIQSTTFKYETEKTSLLPELKKRVPSTFALPHNVLKITPVPFVNPRVEPKPASAMTMPSVSISSNQFATTAVFLLIALGGFFFTLSIASVNSKRSLSYGNEASVSSAASELISEILKSLGLKGRNPSLAVDRNIKNAAIAPEPGTTTAEFGGIGIFPAVNPNADEIAKAKIISSFSDEVTIKPDVSGASGVITPVFKKTNGNDFVYVLVPVNEKKQ